MENIIKQIQNKYGSWQKEKNYYYNCVLKDYGPTIYLNIVFNEQKYRENISFLNQNGVFVPEQLKAFYEKWNGFAFFTHSFEIYGFCDNMDNVYRPLDLSKMNWMLRAQYKWPDELVSFGTYGVYEFCLKKRDKSSVIYITRRDTCKVVNTFDNFVSLIEFCFSAVDKMYDKEGYKCDTPRNTRNWTRNRYVANIFDN